jgi:hypothetical protein
MAQNWPKFWCLKPKKTENGAVRKRSYPDIVEIENPPNPDPDIVEIENPPNPDPDIVEIENTLNPDPDIIKIEKPPNPDPGIVANENNPKRKKVSGKQDVFEKLPCPSLVR